MNDAHERLRDLGFELGLALGLLAVLRRFGPRLGLRMKPWVEERMKERGL